MSSILDLCEKSTVADEQRNRFHGYFTGIKGISSQALDDFKSLTTHHCAFLYPISNFVS